MGRSMFTFLFAGVTILFSMVGGVMLGARGGRFGLARPGGESGLREIEDMISLTVVIAVAAGCCSASASTACSRRPTR